MSAHIAKAQPDAPKRRSLFAFLFVPNISYGISPLREVTGVFVNMLALLFAMNGLFPRNHPALNPRNNVRLGFWDVMRTARSNLVYKKENLPQIVFYYAVVGCISIVVLMAFVGLLSLFVGHAHAASTSGSNCSSVSAGALTSMFSPCGGSSDFGSIFINYLFYGDASGITAFDTSGVSVDTLPLMSPLSSQNQANTLMQCGLYMALGYYSDALLVVAAAILFYHLAWMTVETAHHGQVMGQRGNQIWAPIRLVVAIGLLVPIGNSTTTTGSGSSGCTNSTGLNAGQFLVIKIASWGSGLASNVWATFLNQLQADTSNQIVAMPPGSVRRLVHDAIMMYACQYAVDWYVDGRGGGSEPQDPTNLDAIGYTYNGDGNAAQILSNLDVVDPDFNGWQNASNSAGVGSVGPPSGWGQTLGYDASQAGQSAAIPGTLPTYTAPTYSSYAVPEIGGAASTTPFSTEHFIFTNPDNAGKPLCGSYTIMGAPAYYDPLMPGQSGSTSNDTQTLINNIYADQAIEFYNMLTDGGTGGSNAYANGLEGIQYFIPNDENYMDTPPTAVGSASGASDLMADLVSTYQRALAADIVKEVATYNSSVASSGSGSTCTPFICALENDGWVAAGAWYNRIARLQSDIMVAAVDGMPKTEPPGLLGKPEDYYRVTTAKDLGGKDVFEAYMDHETEMAAMDVYKVAHAELKTLDKYLQTSANNSTGVEDLASMSGADQAAIAAEDVGTSSNSACVNGSAPFLHSMDCLALLVDYAANMYGVWQSVPSSTTGMQNLLGVQFTSANPLAEISAYGNKLIAAAYSILDWGTIFSGAEGFVSGLLATNPTSFGSAITFVGGTLFTLGFLMAYFVPLIPFIQFFFGFIAWVVAMLEAVIMVPLIALAHLNPEGDGLPGDMARSGYFLLFQVFLRPTLMIFGLICGFLIFFCAVTFLNVLFAVAVAGTGGMAHGHFTIARLIYTAIYVMLVLIAANHSFELVARLPNMSMQWLGAGGAQGLDIESVAGLEGRVGLIGGYVGQQATTQLSGLATSVGRVGGTVTRAVGSAITSGGDGAAGTQNNAYKAPADGKSPGK